MFRRTAAIGAALVILSAVATLASTAGATKPCPVQYCTDAAGEYVLEVPPLTGNPLLAEYADCVWNAHVEFGDGTKQDYVFDAAAGLSGSHVFPTRGVLYTVRVTLSGGHHAQGGETCPGYSRASEVLYRTAAEEADDPPPKPPEKEPAPPADESSSPDSPTALAPQAPIPGATGPASALAVEPTAFWTSCHRSIFTHRVSCRKGRKVARAASGKLSRPGSVRVGGFSCHLPRGEGLPILCSRGEEQVLAPSRP